MDAFYYWKNYEQELKAGVAGYFKSSSEKLQALADGQPEFIWAFKTPAGRKGLLQLVARLHWREAPTKGFRKEAGVFYIHYDPKHPSSELYTDSATDEALAVTTAWASRHFHQMRAANFHGAHGQEALRGQPLKELEAQARGFQKRPLVVPVEGDEAVNA
jgi:hypothetical protein